MAKRPSSDGASWSASELKTLKKLASNGTAADAAKALFDAGADIVGAEDRHPSVSPWNGRTSMVRPVASAYRRP